MIGWNRVSAVEFGNFIFPNQWREEREKLQPWGHTIGVFDFAAKVPRQKVRFI